jgi:UDP-N-acetylglucosamine 2-epimerase
MAATQGPLIDIIAGAQPNFMKIAPIIRALQLRQAEGSHLKYRLIHTGQHYDARMSGDFFQPLGIPEPDVNLEGSSGSQAEQTSAIMVKYEKLLLEQRSDRCLVVGDVTSTRACAIAAQKLCLPVAHVEGVFARRLDHAGRETNQLKEMLVAVSEGCRNLPVVFPVHPRTARNLRELIEIPANIKLVEPQLYLEFNYLVKHVRAVMTDAGGITEEITVMGVPCRMLRDTTERPETVSIGTNELIGTDTSKLPPALDRLFAGKWMSGRIPEKWDGKSGERIVEILDRLFSRESL